MKGDILNILGKENQIEGKKKIQTHNEFNSKVPEGSSAFQSAGFTLLVLLLVTMLKSQASIISEYENNV